MALSITSELFCEASTKPIRSPAGFFFFLHTPDRKPVKLVMFTGSLSRDELFPTIDGSFHVEKFDFDIFITRSNSKTTMTFSTETEDGKPDSLTIDVTHETKLELEKLLI